MKDLGLIIKTVQTISGLNYRMPYAGIIDFDEDQMDGIEGYIVQKFNESFRADEGIELIANENEHLSFTMRTSNLDGVSRNEDMTAAYHHFTSICESLHLKAI